MTTASRLTMPLGETMFTQRAIRRVKPDPIPEDDLRDILEAAIRAPSGGNSQPWHFVVIRDPELREEFAHLYQEAWWAKRKDEGINGPEDHSLFDYRRANIGERLVFEPYTKETFERTHRWMLDWEIFPPGQVGNVSYEQAVVR